MNIDNSGATFVFDEKSKQSIEEAKNRITLLQAEEVRYSKLKKSLEAEIIKLEADQAFKEHQLKKTESNLKEVNNQLIEIFKKLDDVTILFGKTKEEFEQREASVAKKEEEIKEFIKSIEKREKELASAEEAVKVKNIHLNEELKFIQEKKSNIEDFISKL